MKKKLTTAGHLLSLFGLLLAVLLLFAQNWLFKSWESLSADEVIYHTKVSLGGTNPGMIAELAFQYLLPGLLVFAVLAFMAFWLKKKESPLRRMIYKLYFLLALMLFVIIGIRLERHMGIISAACGWLTLTNSAGEDFIEENYVDPAEVQLSFPEKKRNLIYIFLESMEMTYADKAVGGAFDPGCIPELQQIALENECFGDGSGLSGAHSLSGSIWTMGALFAQTGGLPLQVPINGKKINAPEDFFPEIVTLGDILEREGYQRTFLLGSKAEFGGRDKYFTQHGHYNIEDYHRALEEKRIPEDYYVWWGFEDEKLFSFAKEELSELSAGQEPFCLTMLTVDTHFPDGYFCDRCREDYGDDQYANVMACSGRQVAEFLEWLRQQDFYENTTVILCGDHPTMDADFCEKVDPSYARRTYTAVINGAAERRTEGARVYSTMDLFPTTLAAMGVKIEGDRLGLGVNLYSSEQTLAEKYGVQECNRRLAKPSLFMKKKGA